MSARANYIVKQLTEADEHYAKTGEDYIPEGIYNDLQAELQDIDPDNDYFKKVQQVTVDSNGKVVHKEPMLSLNKVYSQEELVKWIKSVSRTEDEKFLISPKFDGIAYHFDGNTLVTRGDGEVGEDITSKQFYIGNILKRGLGEIVISFPSFENVVKPQGYKTPRNAVAGLMNQKELIQPLVGCCEAVAYEDFMVEFSLRDLETNSLDTIISQYLNGYLQRYPTDGLVVKLKDESYGNSLGSTSHHNKNSLALKHANQTAVTTLLNVEYQSSKDYIGMVGILDPVEINGVTIKRVSLHNLDVIEELDIKCLDKIEISRAGDVIPHVERVLERPEGRFWPVLSKCPSCGSIVNQEKQFYVCSNDTCEAKQIAKIMTGLSAFKIKGIGEATIEKLYKNMAINGFTDLYHLTDDKLNDVGLREKGIINFRKALQAPLNQKQEYSTAFGALGISGFGISLFKKIFKQIDPLEFASAVMSEDRDKLLDLEQLGPERVELIIQELPKFKGRLQKLIKLFENVLDNPKEESQPKQNKKTICLSGKFPEQKKRYKEILESKGYEMVDKFSKEVDCLLVYQKGGGTGKEKNAQKWGKEVLELSEIQTG